MLTCLALPLHARADEVGDWLRRSIAATSTIPPGVADFYRANGGRPIWIEGAQPNPAARTLQTVLAASAIDGLDARRYGTAAIAALMGRAGDAKAMAELELRLSAALAAYARDVAAGQVIPSEVDPEIFLAPAPPAAPEVLARASAVVDLAGFLRDLPPRRAEYRRLRDALAEHRRIAAAGGWATVPAGPTLRPGTEDGRLPSLRRRLIATGELAAPAGVEAFLEGAGYDAVTEAAVRRFQDRHGLDADGVVGAGTLAALNVPVESRIRQLEINLERRRWLPAELGPRHLFVNLADFSLRAVEGGATVRRFRLVVGAIATRTPVFSAAMTYVEINPNWDVPHKIATRELLARIKADPAWLARNHYLLLPRTGPAVAIDPASVDWRGVTAARFPYRLRQLPGDDNALGRIKFMFPNRFDIYLHDTPAKTLFARSVRAFSHGCLRVDDPPGLAEWIFLASGTPGWTAGRLQAAFDSGQRQIVPLAAPLPVYVGYATAFVGADGRVQFRADLYGRDARLAAALLRSGATS